MKFNGNITLNTLGQSEVQNLVVERLSATPVFASSEAGRLIYNTAERAYYMNSGLGWVKLATGGDAAGLQTEVDALESSIGPSVTASGGFNAAAFSGDLVNATSITDAINKLDAAVKGKDALAELIDVALSMPGAGQFLRYDAVAGKWVNHTMVLANVTDVSATAAEVNHLVGVTSGVQGQINAEKTARADADTALSGRINTEVADRTAADNALTTRIANEETARASADTTLQGNIDAEASTRATADNGLSTRITTEVADRTAADDALSLRINNEVSARTSADTTLQANIDAEASARATADQQLRADMDAKLAGLSWKQSVRVAETAPVANLAGVSQAGTSFMIDGVAVQSGDRVLVMGGASPDGVAAASPAHNGIYVVTVSTSGAVGAEQTTAAFARAADMDVAAEFKSAAVFVEEGTALADSGHVQTKEVVTLGTDPIGFTQFNGASGITAGAGLVKNGNTLYVVSTSGTITVTEDSIDLAQAIRDEITHTHTKVHDEKLRAETAEAGLSTRITDEVNARIADVDAEEAARIAADSSIRTDFAAADTILRDRIAAEELARGNADTALGGRIDTEIADRTAADTVLRDRIAAEELARANGDSALQAKINKGYFLYDGLAATSHIIAHGIGSRFCNVTVIDSATNEQIIPQAVVFDTANQLTVTFNVSLACKVVIMGLAV